MLGLTNGEKSALMTLTRRFCARAHNSVRKEPDLRDLTLLRDRIDLTYGEQDGDRTLRTDVIARLEERLLLSCHGEVCRLTTAGVGYGLALMDAEWPERAEVPKSPTAAEATAEPELGGGEKTTNDGEGSTLPPASQEACEYCQGVRLALQEERARGEELVVRVAAAVAAGLRRRAR